MKENKEYKNEALAALKGRWAPSVLAVLAYMAVLAVFIAPYEIKAMQLSDDPTNLQLAADMMKWYPVFILGCIFVSFPLLVGLVNGFKSLFTDGDDKVLSNEFKIGFEAPTTAPTPPNNAPPTRALPTPPFSILLPSSSNSYSAIAE